MAPNFLSKFVKTNGSLAPSNDGHTRSRTLSDVSSIPRGRTISNAKPNPKVVLTAEGDDGQKQPSTPGSIHRSSSPRDRRPRSESISRSAHSGSTSSRPTPISTPRKSATEVIEMPHTQSPESDEFPAGGQQVQGLGVDLGRTPTAPNLASTIVPAPAAAGQQSLSHRTSSKSLASQMEEESPEAQYARRPSFVSTGLSSGVPSTVASSVSDPGLSSNNPLPPPPPLPESVTSSTISNSASVNGYNSATLQPRHMDSDAVSIASSAISQTKKMPWRRQSGSNKKRKPTGLASAIAASGLAMASPGMNQQLPQIIPAPQSPPKSPPRTFPNTRRTSSASHKPRSRQSSGAYAPNGDDANGSGDFQSDVDSDSDDDLGLSVDDIPVTGFAVASNKRNAEFHENFPWIPEGDYLIEDYGCAWQKEILVQGRLYISENHICFRANILGWITELSIPVHDIISVEKKMTAFFIPNAIQITTRTAKYTFASFLSRDTTYDVIHNIWRLARPDAESIASGDASARQSFDNPRIPSSEDVPETGDGTVRGPPKINKVTQCKCGKENAHYPEVAMNTVFPGTPDKIYNLMFTSGFIKDFMRVEQKLRDMQISDWGLDPETKLLSRNFSYIRPLANVGVGPKQTKCELKDETIHCDFDDYIVTLTTTRTPDVPSGGAFSVKTRTCLMWASSTSTRVMVTTQVEWTGRSFIKSIINSSAIDGQKCYHVDLEKAMRKYIAEHINEFLPEGVEEVVMIDAPLAQEAEQLPLTPTANGVGLSEEEANKRREQERNQRATQWAFDTIMGAYRVAKRSTLDALDLVSDAWDQSSSTTILWFVIVILVFSNLWTLVMMGRREEVGRRKEMKKIEEREKWVHSIVTALWDERTARNPLIEPIVPSSPSIPPPPGSSLDPKAEMGDLTKMLDYVEDRVRTLRKSLEDLD